MITWTHPGANYRTRLPQSILDAGLDSNGEPDPTSQDRRWLWRIELFLSNSGTNPTHRQMAADLRFYLDETCEHHWKSYEAYGDVAAHRQCSWCCDVEWAGADLYSFDDFDEIRDEQAQRRAADDEAIR